MSRAGEVRQALRAAAQALAAERGGATWRELCERARVGYATGKQTARDMERAGELERIGAVPVTGSRRPMLLYRPAGQDESAAVGSDAMAVLNGALRGWAR